MAFDSTAARFLGSDEDLNGAIRDVFVRDTRTGAAKLISKGLGGAPADGASAVPSISADGRRVAFVSLASNLVPGDTNGQADVFLAIEGEPLRLVSRPFAAGPANGPSAEPDIDPSGRFVAFSSGASNLLPGDDNGQADVFLADTDSGALTRVSVAGRGGSPRGRSSAPAVSRNGAFVAFESGADDIVRGDTNQVADVFVRNMSMRRTERVSVSTSGRQQNAAITPPFLSRPDISDDGTRVVFDSDADTLTRRDDNDRTDVFLRDRRRGTTVLVSASSLGVQGNNDSVTPRISGNGRLVAFQSFAANLTPDDPRGPDIFVRDLSREATVAATVADDGSARTAERVDQLLQRPALSTTGKVVAFTSTAGNLAPPDANALEDVFTRRIDAQRVELTRRPTTVRPRLRLRAPGLDKLRAVCRVDRRRPVVCPPDLDVRSLKSPGGRLVLLVGARGVLPARLTFRLPGRALPPRVRIARPSRGPLRVVKGTATAGTRRVEVGLIQFRPGFCVQLRRRAFVRAGCKATVLSSAVGGRHWRLRLPGAVRGTVIVYARAIDETGRHGPFTFRSVTVG